jgi:hypothetical protein
VVKEQDTRQQRLAATHLVVVHLHVSSLVPAIRLLHLVASLPLAATQPRTRVTRVSPRTSSRPAKTLASRIRTPVSKTQVSVAVTSASLVATSDLPAVSTIKVLLVLVLFRKTEALVATSLTPFQNFHRHSRSYASLRNSCGHKLQQPGHRCRGSSRCNGRKFQWLRVLVLHKLLGSQCRGNSRCRVR